MEKRTILKVAAILFAIILPVIIFNWGTISTGLATLNIYTFLIIALLVLAAGPLYLFGNWIDQKLRLRTATSLTSLKLKKILKQDQRERNARECLNRFRKTDYYLMLNGGQEMEIIARVPSPSRDDAVQWEMFLFSTEKYAPYWNPGIGNDDGKDGIPPEHLFYVFVNCNTGETYFRRFGDYDEALEAMKNLWGMGVKELKASEFEKYAMTGFSEELGKMMAQRGVKPKEEEEPKKEKGEKE